MSSTPVPARVSVNELQEKKIHLSPYITKGELEAISIVDGVYDQVSSTETWCVLISVSCCRLASLGLWDRFPRHIFNHIGPVDDFQRIIKDAKRGENGACEAKSVPRRVGEGVPGRY